MTDRNTPPTSPRRIGSIGLVPQHIPAHPSRLRETISRSPDNRRSYFEHEDTDQSPSPGSISPPFLLARTSEPVTAEPEPLKEDGDHQAEGTIIEPTDHEEDERTALLHNYHNHHHRVCGLRSCNHGTFSPRPMSRSSTMNGSIDETNSPRYSLVAGEHPQPRSFGHAILGDPIADALLGTQKSTSRNRTKADVFNSSKFAYFAYYLPCVRWISQYQWSWFRGDLAAALTMASFYIPMSLSYATNLGHIPALNGLYSFAIHPLMYALLGSCPQMAVGPEAPGSLLVGMVVTTCIQRGDAGDADSDLHAQIAGVVTATAGSIIFVAGLARLGFLDSVLSRPFLRGFISAIGVVIFVDQTIPELGLGRYVDEAGIQHGSTAMKIGFLVRYIKYSHKLTAAVSWTAFAIIMFFRDLKKRLQPRYPAAAYFPDRFLVVVIATILTWQLGWGEQGLERLGKVTAPGRGVFAFSWPFRFERMQHIDTALSTSLIIALLGFFESSVAAKSLGDGTTELRGVNVSANRELIALGTANLVGGCFMSLPAFGGYGRSKVNVSTGGVTPMSGALLSLISILCAFFVLPYFYYIPKGVLSAMISVVAFSLVEEAPHDIRFFIKIKGWTELALMAVIFLATIFYSLTVGIALGMGLSLLQIVRHATKPRIQILGRVPGAPGRFENAEVHAEEIEHITGCLIVKIPEPLTFANTGALKDRLRRFEKYGTAKAHPSLPRVRHDEHNKNIIFDIHGVTSIDGSGTQVLTEIVEGYINRGARVVFCRLPHRRSKVYESFERSGIVELCGGKRHFVGSIDEALKLAEAEDLEAYFLGRGAESQSSA